MNNVLKGGCLCGEVRYELMDSPIVVYYCHCNDCKKSTGSAFHVGLVMKKDNIKITGKLKQFTKLADSGHHMTRFFCENCGSPLFTKDCGAEENLVVKAGSLDEPGKVQPSIEIWTVHEVTWAVIKPDIKSLAKGRAYQL